jgi:hypothetical protein
LIRPRRVRRKLTPAPEPYDPAAAAAETERLRHELADRILRLRCKYPNRCNYGACRRAKVCQRLI